LKSSKSKLKIQKKIFGKNWSQIPVLINFLVAIKIIWHFHKYFLDMSGFFDMIVSYWKHFKKLVDYVSYQEKEIERLKSLIPVGLHHTYLFLDAKMNEPIYGGSGPNDGNREQSAFYTAIEQWKLRHESEVSIKLK